jgi:hypothetical protein
MAAKLGSKLRHALSLGARDRQLPVLVISDVDSMQLQALCALTVGQSPALQQLAVVPAALSHVRARPGRHLLGALLDLDESQVHELAAQAEVLGLELAI